MNKLQQIKHQMEMENWHWKSSASTDEKRAAYLAVVDLMASPLGSGSQPANHNSQAVEAAIQRLMNIANQWADEQDPLQCGRSNSLRDALRAELSRTLEVAPVGELKEALRRIQYEAVSLADAQVVALEALSIRRVPVASVAVPIGFIAKETLDELQNPDWQMQRNTPANLWTINNPPSRAVIPVYVNPTPVPGGAGGDVGALTCPRSNRSDCALFDTSPRPSKEWYAAKIKDTEGLDSALPCGALATPAASVPAGGEVPEGLIACLRGGRQCDETGEEIIMSRQACCEAADILERFATQPPKQDAAPVAVEAVNFNLSQERATARRHGYLEALSVGTARQLVDLLKRGLKQLEAWHVLYGAHNPEWLPPHGDVRWMEDVAEALEGRATPAVVQPGLVKVDEDARRYRWLTSSGKRVTRILNNVLGAEYTDGHDSLNQAIDAAILASEPAKAAGSNPVQSE